MSEGQVPTTPPPVRWKICARCRQNKHATEFGEDLRMRVGLKSYCRACERIVRETWRELSRG